MIRCAVLLAIALAGCAASPEQIAQARADDAAELARALDGRVPGTPQDCIASDRADGPQIIGQSLLYRDAGKLWRSDVIGSCPSLHGDPIIVAEVFGARLCRGDKFRTVQRGGGIPGPYCRFGSFTPYARKDR